MSKVRKGLPNIPITSTRDILFEERLNQSVQPLTALCNVGRIFFGTLFRWLFLRGSTIQRTSCEAAVRQGSSQGGRITRQIRGKAVLITSQLTLILLTIWVQS